MWRRYFEWGENRWMMHVPAQHILGGNCKVINHVPLGNGLLSHSFSCCVSQHKSERLSGSPVYIGLWLTPEIPLSQKQVCKWHVIVCRPVFMAVLLLHLSQGCIHSNCIRFFSHDTQQDADDIYPITVSEWYKTPTNFSKLFYKSTMKTRSF